MPDSFRLNVVTPEGEVVDTQVVEMTAPGINGEFGVLPKHVRFLTALGVGELRYRTIEGEQGVLAVAGGFAEVNPEGVSVLAQTAETAEKIDVARAEAALRRAEDRLAVTGDAVDIDRAILSMERSRTRLRVAEARGVRAARTTITTTEMPIPGEQAQD